jgi:hypothetical protein
VENKKAKSRFRDGGKDGNVEQAQTVYELVEDKVESFDDREVDKDQTPAFSE